MAPGSGSMPQMPAGMEPEGPEGSEAPALQRLKSLVPMNFKDDEKSGQM
eukprot:CAMPEP_0185576380 /NCGR_PEP_ID=MMETSP0434-20130131/7322_1 /TAXON_ID=626734 ORGANISM="Favella taraikaensis, Strain Fe Narragansett Bay" /NCGR_SAMPLE_ID=MMETSP0434 /ASSEMBLY_ACC=CAM_ASM_000379 /LENGTH=48 /DNA_ID= /DNA_START= /DNA_END= /DNA_ORIENTATION=